MTLVQARAEFARRIKSLEALMASKDMPVTITCGMRTMEEQAALYANGRTAPGPKVTNAKPGQSAHNYGLAVDYIFVRNGKRTYNVPASWWVFLGVKAKQCGLKWGGTFKKLLDRPHVEFPGWEKFKGAK